MIALSLALVFGQATLSVPAGTYRLSELATTLRAQGVEVGVSADCAEDVFVARLENVAWSDLSAALVKTGRLQVKGKGSGWTVERSREAASGERAALMEYLRAATKQVETTYAPLVTTILELGQLSEEEREARKQVLGQNRGVSDAAGLLDNTVYLHFGNELPFEQVALPLVLARFPNGLPLGQYVTTDLMNMRDVFNHDGHWKKLDGAYRMLREEEPTAEQLDGLARNGRISVKMPFDPLTLVKNVGWRIWWDREFVVICSVQRSPVYSVPSMPKIEASDVWTAGELSAQNERARRTVDALAVPGSSADLGATTSIRVSEALLRDAAISRSNLLCPVSAYTDDVVELSGMQTFATILASGEAKGIGEWASDKMSERVVSYTTSSTEPALRPVRRRTAERIGGVLVVRDERQFLDRLCPTPTALPSEMENEGLQGGLPALTELARHIASLKVEGWSNSAFATGYLRFCNPASFLPFARAIAASPAFSDRLTSLPIYVLPTLDARGSKVRDYAWDVAFRELEPKVQKALRQGISEAARQNDAVDKSRNFFEPGSALQILEQRPADVRFRALRRSERRIEFELSLEFGVLWRSWVENVELK